METMAMTHEEKIRFDNLQKRVDDIEDELHGLSSKIDRILSIVKGIAIGLVVGALLFGLLKFQDLVDVVK